MPMQCSSVINETGIHASFEAVPFGGIREALNEKTVFFPSFDLKVVLKVTYYL